MLVAVATGATVMSSHKTPQIFSRRSEERPVGTFAQHRKQGPQGVLHIPGYPAELVKSKFMKLDDEHIRFVLDCMRENTTKIRNIKQYLKAALFNAPSTIGNYYTSLVAHDMASGALSPKKPQYGDPDYYSCNEGESL